MEFSGFILERKMTWILDFKESRLSPDDRKDPATHKHLHGPTDLIVRLALYIHANSSSEASRPSFASETYGWTRRNAIRVLSGRAEYDPPE